MTRREREIIQGVIEILKTKLHPSKIILFGSRAKGRGMKGSDFDLAVDGKRPRFSIEREVLEAVEGVAGLYGVDIVYLRDVDQNFRKVVRETGKVIYEKRR